MTTTILGPLPDGVVSVVSTAANWLVLLCIVPLCWSTWRYGDLDDPRRGNPRPVTWGIWFLVGMVATVGLALGGAPTSAWSIKLFLSLGPIIVAGVALYRPRWLTRRWGPWQREPLLANWIDKWSLVLGGIGLALYVLVYFGFIGPADPYAAGLVAAGTAIAVDAIGAWPTWAEGWQYGAPTAEIVTFTLALVSVVAVLCILPWPWTWLSATYLVFLGLQMISIIVVDVWGRHRAQLGQSTALA